MLLILALFFSAAFIEGAYQKRRHEMRLFTLMLHRASRNYKYDKWFAAHDVA